MFILSHDLKLITTFNDLNKIPKIAKQYGVTKEQCQSLVKAHEPDIVPFSYTDKKKWTILSYKSYE